MWGAPSSAGWLGHDVVAIVRDIQAASRRLPSGIALRVADYEDASALKRALAGIEDMVLISRWQRERSHAPPRQRHRGSYGDQHPAYYFHEHRRYGRVVAILLLTCLPRRRAPASGLRRAFDHPHYIPTLFSNIGLCRAKRRESTPQDMVGLHRSRVTTWGPPSQQ
jgi:hypothetical protein